ncbi:hypothetical protein Goarm_000305 [Gossypium armourianum]|uniref:1-acylglycerol-3-phosphate O-acyltransferase n=1 Tax=Gossypium armourianum TaxID=34283 RepID=A0A7J9K9D6_9ROSI|nr:hypothetical protein [Gossypium armourianum]
MEVPSAKHETRHRRLTPLRVLRGLICLLVLLLTAFMMIVYCGFFSTVVLRLFSVHYSRKVTAFFFSSWLALWPFLFEKINKTKVIFSGDDVPARERVLLICNHRTEVDWMYLWDLALRKDSLGYIKYILKSSLMKLPVFGWSFQILEFIPVERKWEVDEAKMRQMLSKFKDPRDPLWLVLFPEGTDFTYVPFLLAVISPPFEQKCLSSQKYAAANGLPILKNLLLPKSKGFNACLEDLRSTLDAVYDVTIGYKHRCPSFLDNVFGVDPSEVHIHIRRVTLDDIPLSEWEVTSWLMDTFQRKDQLLSNFNSEGYFPLHGAELNLSTVKCLINVMLVLVLTGAFSFLTFFSSIWFKIFVSLSCSYMVSATYLNIRPEPIFNFVKTSL